MKYKFNTVLDRTNTFSLKYVFAQERNRPQGILPMWVADMDFEVAPTIKKRLHQVVEHGIYGYSDSKDEYFQAVSNWYGQRFNFITKKEWLIKTPGVVFALAQAVLAFSKIGDGVLIQPPVYYPFKEVIINNNRRVITNPLLLKDGHYEIDFNDFEQKIKNENVKLFLLCSPHNPVGRVWKKAELLRLGEICLKNNVKIISDEIHSDFVYPGNKHYVLASLNSKLQNITMTCTAPTKTFNLAGLQISNIFIANENMREQFKKTINSTGYSQCNLVGLVATQEAYQTGEKWLLKLNNYLFENIQFVSDFLTKELPQIKLIKPEGTYLLWLDFSKLNLSKKQLDDLITNKAGLWLDDGLMFGKEGMNFQRINISCPRVILNTALQQLKAAIKSNC